MLRLLATGVDICQISKVLGRQRIKSFITKSTIIIETDEISDEIVDMLFKNATIISAQNYYLDESETGIDTKTESEQDDETSIDLPVEQSESIDIGETDANCTASVEIPTNEVVEVENESSTENDKINETSEVGKIEVEDKTTNKKIPKSKIVHRGEVYKLSDIRNDDIEGKIKECVIIIQNDYQNSVSDDTIALFCTTHYEEREPIHFSIQLTEKTMIDHNANRLKLFDKCTFFVSRIKGISRNHLGSYLGTINNLFMNTLQPVIDFCLGLKRSRTVNWAQLKILSTINMEDLFKISESNVSNKQKVDEFLELFGFDMSINGVQYVEDSILFTQTLSDYNLEILAKKVAKKREVEANEVFRLIVARIKENFQFKKSPTISFIRLIDKLLKKG